MKNKKSLAQFFTPPNVCKMMVGLCKNEGQLLEPACGDGRLVETFAQDVDRTFQEIISIELDSSVAPHYAKVMDFFSYPFTETFDSVISNPPYLANKQIPASTRELPAFKAIEARMSGYTNLYGLMLAKMFFHLNKGGEIVAVVPSDVFQMTGNSKLNELLHANGTITDVIKFKKSPFLPDVSQEVLIFRYERDNMSHETNLEIV